MDDLITQEEITKIVNDSMVFLNKKLTHRSGERGCYANLDKEEILIILNNFSLIKEYYEL